MGRKSDAKTRLIESAMELLFTHSYGAVGVKELCERAGVKKGSLYHFFPSKRTLILKALDTHWKEMSIGLLAQAFSKDLPPLKRIERLFELCYNAIRAQKKKNGFISGCPFGNLAAELSTQDEVIRRKIATILNKVANYFEQTLDEAQTAGEIEGVDSAAAAQALAAYLEGVLLLAKLHKDPELVRKLGHQAVSLATGVEFIKRR